jgi:hypothetical protein
MVNWSLHATCGLWADKRSEERAVACSASTREAKVGFQIQDRGGGDRGRKLVPGSDIQVSAA